MFQGIPVEVRTWESQFFPRESEDQTKFAKLSSKSIDPSYQSLIFLN